MNSITRTTTTYEVLTRNENGVYQLWLNTDYDSIMLVQGVWLCATTLPAFYNTDMVEKHLHTTFPNVELSIAPKCKTTLFVTTNTNVSVSNIGE